MFLVLKKQASSLHKLYIHQIFCATSVQRYKQEKCGSKVIDALKAAWYLVPRTGIEPVRPCYGSNGF